MLLYYIPLTEMELSKNHAKSVPLTKEDDAPSLSELYGQPSKDEGASAGSEKPINPQDEEEEVAA